MHYGRWKRHGATDPPPSHREDHLAAARAVIAVKRVIRQVTCGHTLRKHKALGMCASCYTLHLQKFSPRCRITACQRAATNGVLCGMHAARLNSHGTTEVTRRRGGDAARMQQLREMRNTAGPRVNECGHPERPHTARGMCKSCYLVEWQKRHPGANTASQWLKNNPEKARVHRRAATLRKHGITIARYQEIWTVQGGRCANGRCGRAFDLVANDYRHALQVDHCHASGGVRGLLCAGCNTALGHIDDDTERLQGLIEYVESFRR